MRRMPLSIVLVTVVTSLADSRYRTAQRRRHPWYRHVAPRQPLYAEHSLQRAAM
jgi:hypothetical protein